MSKWLHHVGIIVNNLDEAAKLYGNMLGLAPGKEGVMKNPEDGLQVLMLPLGDISIELIEPIGLERRYARFLKERGEGLFHLSLFTDDFDAEVRELKEKGFTVEEEVVGGPEDDYEVRLAWLPPDETRGVWIELADAKSIPEV